MKKRNRALLLFRRPKWKQRVAWPEAAMEGQFSRLVGRDRDAPSFLLPFSIFLSLILPFQRLPVKAGSQKGWRGVGFGGRAAEPRSGSYVFPTVH